MNKRELFTIVAMPMADVELLQAEVEQLRADVAALTQENEAMRRCAIKYLSWLDIVSGPLDKALREDMANPDMCGDAAMLAARAAAAIGEEMP